MEKILKNATVLDVLCNIAFAVVLLVFLASLSSLVTIFRTESSSFLIGASIRDNLLETQGKYFSISTDNILDITFLQDKSQVKTSILVWQTLSSIAIASTFFCVFSLKKILSCILKQQPFHGEISKYINILGWSILGVELFSSSLQSISTLICKLLIEDFYRGALFLVKPELLFILFLFSTLSAVFRYGEELQKQADDTI